MTFLGFPKDHFWLVLNLPETPLFFLLIPPEITLILLRLVVNFFNSYIDCAKISLETVLISPEPS